jgi:hypothetical protein
VLGNGRKWHYSQPSLATLVCNLLRILQRSVLALPDPAPLAGEYQQVGMLDAAPFGARVPA